MSDTKYYNQIIEEAVAAGEEALYACVPTPMRFYPADLSGKALGEGSIEPEGDCGGAYITGINGNDPFIKWSKKSAPELITKGVYKGYDVYGSSLHKKMKVPYNGQSAERYEAFARAAAKVFNENGIKCYVKTYLT